MQAIYRFHSDYAGSKIWWGEAELTWGRRRWRAGT